MSIDWDALRDACVAFTQKLIQTPSMTYQETAVAQLIAAELGRLDYDEIWLDDIGNVYGRMHGQDRSLPALVLNTHTDHVDPGDPALWPVPPYSGAIVDGRIYGRGACDIKGPLAVQVYAAAALRQHGQRPRRDVVFCGVVQEEIGGGGAQYWIDHLDYPVDLVVLGEPSSNQVSLGHRGIYQVWVTFPGRSAHASAPERADNPNYAAAAFLTALAGRQGELPGHLRLGPTTVAPTLVQVDTTSANVTPAWTRVLLDFRTAAATTRQIHDYIYDVAGRQDITIVDNLDGADAPPSDPTDAIITGFDTDPDHPDVRRAVAAIGEGMGHVPQMTSYRFATDGRLFVERGLTMIGYAPGEEELAHTARESIAIDDLVISLRGHVALLQQF